MTNRQALQQVIIRMAADDVCDAEMAALEEEATELVAAIEAECRRQLEAMIDAAHRVVSNHKGGYCIDGGVEDLEDALIGIADSERAA